MPLPTTATVVLLRDVFDMYGIKRLSGTTQIFGFDFARDIFQKGWCLDINGILSIKDYDAASFTTSSDGKKIIKLRNPDNTESFVSFGISQYYKFFIPAQQFIGSGDAKDRSSNGADAVRLASLSDATAWANPGYVTTGAGANAGLSIPVNKFAFDLGYQSVLLSFRLKKAAPVGSESIVGCGDAGSAQGFYLSMRAASGGVSKIRPVLNTSGGVVSGLADSLATFGEVIATDHVVTLAIDGITKSVFLYCDGTLSNAYTNAFTGGTITATSFGIGANNGNVGAASVASQYSGVHFLVFDGGLPLNLGMLAQLLASAPHTPLTDAIMVF